MGDPARAPAALQRPANPAAMRVSGEPWTRSFLMKRSYSIQPLLGVLAALVSVGAGIYLLTSESASADTTVFDILMHGIGAYFVARGMWMLYSLRRPG